MLYKKEIPIPFSTQINSPVEIIFPITAGTITRVGIFIPWGCADLVGIQIYRYTFQITPLTRGEWMKGNDILHSYKTHHNIDQEPWSLIVKGYNLDDTYSHTPYVQIEMSRNSSGRNLEQLLQQLS